MKDIKIAETVYIEDYDINLTPYISPENIQAIGETLLEYDSTIERECCLGFLILRLCTDVEDSVVDEMESSELMMSGLYQTLLHNIKNMNQLYRYVEHQESADVALSVFLNKTLPNVLTNINTSLGAIIERTCDGADVEKMMSDLPQNLISVLRTIREDGNAQILNNVMELNKNDNE